MMGAWTGKCRIPLMLVSPTVMLLLLVVVIVGLPGFGSSKTIVVDINGDGDFTSIQEAVDWAVEGDEIRVHDGTYEEPVVVNTTIDLMGNGSLSTFIDAGENDAVVITADGVTVQGFSILGGAEDHNGICVESDANRIVDIVSSGNRRIYLMNAENNHIENVTVFNTSLSAIFLYRSDDNTIVNASCTSSAFGIHLQESDNNMLFSSNCSGNGDGIGVRGAHQNSIWHCILSNNTGAGLRIMYSSYGNSISHSHVQHNEDGIVFGSSDIPDTFCLKNAVINVTCTDNDRFGILILNSREDSFDKITLSGNGAGFSFGEGATSPSVTLSNIFGNAVAGVNSTVDPDRVLTATGNWWGDPSGPYHAFDNPNGTGDSILGNVSFTPWSTFMFDLDDHTPPPAPTNLTIDRIEYFDTSTNISYFRYGENYTITVHGPSILDDPQLDYLVFHAGSSNYLEYDVSDNEYSYNWTAGRLWYNQDHIYVVAYDAMGNSAFSDTIQIAVVGSFLYLTIMNISFSDPTPQSGENVSITITVHTEVFLNGTARNVKIKVFKIDGDGNQEYIGEIVLGDLDPTADLYPDDPMLGPGDFLGTLHWTTPGHLYHGENETYTIRAQVDPDGYVQEKLETNNQAIMDIEVKGMSTGSPKAYFKEFTRVGGWHDLEFEILVESSVRVRSVEYRFNGSEVWRYAHSPMAEDDEWSDGISVWFFHFNTGSLEPGNYSFELRVFDGLHYSDPAFGDFKVLAWPIEGDGKGDGDPDHVGLFMVVSLLLSLMLILAYVIRTPSHRSAPPSRSPSTTSPGPHEEPSRTGRFHAPPSTSSSMTSPGPHEETSRTGRIHVPPSASSSMTSSGPDQEPPAEATCSTCGNDVRIDPHHPAIRVVCQHCGKESVSEDLWNEEFNQS